MSADTQIRAGLEIQANVKGTQQIHQLADSIEAAGVDASKLREQGVALAQTWQQLESRKALIEHFKSLQTAADGLADELKAAQEQSEKLKQAWQADKDNENTKMAYVRQAKAVSDLSKKQDELRQKLQHARAAMNEAGIAVKDLAKHEAQLAQESAAARNKLAAFTREAEKLNKIASAKQTLGLDVDAGARQEIQRLNQAFADLKKHGGLTQQELARAAELHTQKLRGLEAQLGKTGISLQETASEIGNLITRSGGLAYVSREAVKFEAAMAGVKKVTDGTPEQMAQLSGEIKNMAGELGIVPDELARIAAAGGQMGVQMDRLPEFTRMAAQMANAFGITSEQAGSAAAKISNVYQLSIEQMGELGDAINTLGNTTAAKEAEITEVLLRIGGNAKQFGLLKEEAAALSAALIALGKTPETAGTAINAMLTKLQTASVQSGKFKDSLQQLGLSAEQMAANIAANPQAALTDFLKRLEQVDKQSRAIMLSEMFGAEYADDLALLSGSLKTYEDALANATDKGKTFGAMQREAAAATETTEGKMKKAQAELAAAAVELGNALLPVVQAGAAALGNVADAVQAFNTQFPALSQLAVLLVSAKVAIGAYQTAMRVAGVEGSASILKTDLNVQKLRASIISTAAAAKTLGKDIKNAFSGNTDAMSGTTGRLRGMGQAVASLTQNIGMMWAAWEAGKGIGTALRENVEWIRDMGDGMGKLIAYADALFTERTFEDVRNFYKTTRQLEREQREETEKATKAAQKRAAAEKKAAAEQAAQIQILQAKHRQLRQEYQALTGSMETLKQAGKENTAMYRDLAQQQTELGIKVQASGAQLAKLNAQIGDTGPLADSKKALEALGLSAEEVASGIGGKARAALDDFGKAAAQFGNDAEQMQRIFQAALSKMGDSPEAINALKDKLAEVGRQAGLSADEIRKIGDTADAVSAAFDKIGVDSSAVLTGISREARQAFDDFTAASKTAADAGIKDNRLLAASFEQMMGKLKSPQEFAAFKQQLQESGQAAKLTQEQLARLNAAAREGAAGAQTAYGRLAEAVKQAGDTRAVQAVGQAAAAAMKRGEIGAEQYAQVLEAVKRRTEELKQKTAQAGDTAAQAHSKAAAAAQSQAAATETAAAAQKQQAYAAEQNVQTVKRQTAALNDLGQAVDEVLRRNQAWKHLGTEAWPRLIRMTQDAVIGATRATRDLNAEMERGGDVATALARAEGAAAQGLKWLDRATLDNLNAAIDKARQKMKAFSDESKQTLEDTQARLAELNGDNEAQARLAQQRKLKELAAKRDAAKRAGNRQAAADYEQSIALQQQIWQRQQQQKAEEAARQQREAEERARAEAERREQEARREAERERQEREREAERRRQEAEAQHRPAVNTAEIADYLTGGLPEKIHIGNLDLSGVRQAVQQGFQTAAEQGAQQALNQLEKEIQDAQARSR